MGKLYDTMELYSYTVLWTTQSFLWFVCVFFPFVKSYSGTHNHLAVKVKNDKCSSKSYTTRGITV